MIEYDIYVMCVNSSTETMESDIVELNWRISSILLASNNTPL